jgi:hypothetical protein
MNKCVAGVGAMLLIAASASDTWAVTCARGVHRAGCVGATGAVVTTRPVATHRPVVVATPRAAVVATPRGAVVAAPVGCRYVNGRRIC